MSMTKYLIKKIAMKLNMAEAMVNKTVFENFYLIGMVNLW